MDNINSTKCHWEEGAALEVWKHHASTGGADKDRMITIASLLLGFSVAIVAFTFKEAKSYQELIGSVGVVFLASAGIAVSIASALITLIYGGYANRNWAKADQIAHDYKWERLYPLDSPFAPNIGSDEYPPCRVAWALRQSGPKATHKELAPVFECFFWLSVASGGMHLLILLWGIWTLLSGHFPRSSFPV